MSASGDSREAAQPLTSASPRVVAEGRVVALADDVAVDAVILAAATRDLDRSERGGEAAGALPFPAVDDPVEETRAICIAATGGIDERRRLDRGDLVAVFPEGTTSDGTRLLKFHSSLLQPIVDARGVVQPIAIRYRTPADDYSAAPAFVGDLTMVGSLWRLTGERSLVAELTILPQLPAADRSRRELSSAAAAAIQTVLASPARARAPDTRGGRRA